MAGAGRGWPMAERIGVTGPRWTRLDRACEPALAAELGRVLADLDRTAGPGTLVTGMAEGTDLIAARVRPAGWTLEAVLPLARHLATTCDRLIAVWNGRPGQPGGTGSVVARARALGREVLRIDPSGWLRQAPPGG